METRQISELYAQIGQELIDTEDALADVANSQASIIYLSSDASPRTKDSIKQAVCEKVADKNKWAIPADFTITVFEPNIAGFTDEQLKILIFHELLHVGVIFKEDNTEAYYCKDHDYQDFKIIIDRYGTDWSRII